MIAYLKGDFVHKSPALVQVDVNGVGYEVQISLNTWSRIQQLEKGMLHTSLLIREDAHILYGFFDLAEKEMFHYLISVSGIGASTARVMLSYMKPDELVRAIISADTRTLEGIKGIGKKTAERMVLELRDKLAKYPLESNISPLKNNTLQQDALNALMALGISRQAASQALDKTMAAESNLSVEELIKKTLRTL
ncbi:MAG TPA: Holliday junction branch migration protein RuvA [Chitinophagaceae bacterium]